MAREAQRLLHPKPEEAKTLQECSKAARRRAAKQARREERKARRRN